MTHRSERPLTVIEGFTSRMNLLRRRQRITQRALADRLANLGVHLHHTAIAKIEGGKRGVGLDEALAIAGALGVAPVHLIAPTGVHHPRIEVAPAIQLNPSDLREWIRGRLPLIDAEFNDWYYAEAPHDEFEEHLRRWFGPDTDIDGYMAAHYPEAWIDGDEIPEPIEGDA